MTIESEQPHWNFEAFRNFIGFAPIQQACTSLLQLNGITLTNAEVELRHLNRLLLSRTGREWTPDRKPGGAVLWETEGSLFRNKKRVFTSFYLLDAEKFESEDRLVLTDFGRAVADGLITETDFYRTIIQRFRFPHPAYEENWRWWSQANRELKPLALILRIVSHLSVISSRVETVSIREIAYFGGPNPSTKDAEVIAINIKNSRDTGEQIQHVRSDAHDRKIGDMIAFLAMTPWAAIKAQGITLNPIRKDLVKSTYDWLDVDSIANQIAEVTGENG
jgi:hypothetical protein